MIRIRFHGRGGHGIKTASRIVGTAAFLSGFHTQDSPIYGAERRGAAIAAFTRIDAQPIFERGVITEPGLIVIGDESLLDDASAAVLVGQEFARAALINTADATQLVARYQIQPEIIATDLTALTLEKLGSMSALSAGLAAATARLIAIISQDALLQATQEELQHTGLSAEPIEKNLALAAEVFGKLKPIAGRPPFQLPGKAPSAAELASVWSASRSRVPAGGAAIAAIAHHPPILSTPSILAAGNSIERQTGTWRVERPIIDYERCTRCGICFVRCPDGAIALDAEGYPQVDYDHCKGCMECWNQCPVEGAIRKEKEVRAW